MTDTPLWRPDPARVEQSRMAEFRRWLAAERGVEVGDYQALWEWSTSDLEAFWGALTEFMGVRFHTGYDRVLGSAEMPGAVWFPGATLNYAEHALSVGADDAQAVIFEREDGLSSTLTYGELRSEVAAVRAALVELGVRRGDRVVALAPNMPRTLVAFLAAASLGATWSSCSPDFGVKATADRFTQIEPVVLFAVDGYVYNGRAFDVRPTIAALQEQIPTLRATVLIDYLSAEAVAPDTVRWSDFVRPGAELAFDPVPFDHPLWVLYSSGTTGLPKGIVQGQGGIVVEHLKMLALHADFGPGDRFFWFTTTGWMMWNYLVSALLVGATVVMYDGSPGHPDLGTLWRLAARHKVTYFGTSAPYIQSCLKQGLTPAKDNDLTALKALGSTGAPLSPEGFQWIADALGTSVQICSVSGGTDLCTAFVGSAPDVPVWLGELSCRTLGAAVESWSPEGKPLVDEVGELVITKPMPSMPLYLWADETGEKMRESYFEPYPGTWRHGDWIRITRRGSAVIYGRSDSTLNRGGVRMGTSEFYRVVEAFDEVADSLVIDTSSDREGELVCYLVLADGVTLEAVEPQLRSALRSALSPRHVPDRFVVIKEVPRTLNGKKCEVPVKKILAGVPPERAVSKDALANPGALAAFLPS
ncbi:acetoacetate--CoA ligase [Actinophytocola sp.]|uniref:acetoacetate--CoA ligase n=1 Tax=Actinophytocola sp. TaxID=1872138 RepID=UPI002D585F7D|nr:acetoacetate--CoA ligase [Actinophytocola sp.]HYQ67137.1 acetoacetate--CoA ligase [Actinophytocola sp.]